MSNLFKYTKRVLTSVLAAAVVLTAIPSTAFGAEIDEDLAIEVQETEVAEAGEEVVVENEDALTTDGASSDEEVIVEGGDEDPDQSKNDLTLTFILQEDTDADGKTVKVYSPNQSDTLTAIAYSGKTAYTGGVAPATDGHDNTITLAVDSEKDLVLFVEPKAGFKLADENAIAPVIKYNDYSQKDSGFDAKTLDKDSDPTASSMYTAPLYADYAADGLNRGTAKLTITSDTLKSLVAKYTNKDKTVPAAAATATIELAPATQDTYTIGWNCTAEGFTPGGNALNRANVGAVIERRVKGANASDTTALFPSTTTLQIAKFKVTGIVKDKSGNVIAEKTAEVSSTGAVPHTSDITNIKNEGTQWKDKDWIGFDTQGNGLIGISAAATSLAYQNERTITIKIDASEAGAAEKRVVTVNGDYVNFYNQTTSANVATDADKIKYALPATEGNEEDRKSTDGADYEVVILPKSAANGGTRTLKKVTYTIGTKTEEVNLPLTNDHFQIPGSEVVGAITVNATTYEQVLTPTVVDDSGAAVANAATVINTDGTVATAAETGSRYSFAVRTAAKYIVKKVEYKIGTGDYQVATASNGVYTTNENVTNTLAIKVTVAEGEDKYTVETAADYTSTSPVKVFNGEVAGGKAITDTTKAQVPAGNTFTFQVAPVGGKAIKAVTYTMGVSTAALKPTALAKAGYYSIANVTGNVVITVTVDEMIDIQLPTNPNIKFYLNGSSTPVASGVTEISVSDAQNMSFRVESTKSNIEVKDIYYFPTAYASTATTAGANVAIGDLTAGNYTVEKAQNDAAAGSKFAKNTIVKVGTGLDTHTINIPDVLVTDAVKAGDDATGTWTYGGVGATGFTFGETGISLYVETEETVDPSTYAVRFEADGETYATPNSKIEYEFKDKEGVKTNIDNLKSQKLWLVVGENTNLAGSTGTGLFVKNPSGVYPSTATNNSNTPGANYKWTFSSATTGSNAVLSWTTSTATGKTVGTDVITAKIEEYNATTANGAKKVYSYTLPVEVINLFDSVYVEMEDGSGNAKPEIKGVVEKAASVGSVGYVGVFGVNSRTKAVSRIATSTTADAAHVKTVELAFDPDITLDNNKKFYYDAQLGYKEIKGSTSPTNIATAELFATKAQTSPIKMTAKVTLGNGTVINATPKSLYVIDDEAVTGDYFIFATVTGDGRLDAFNYDFADTYANRAKLHRTSSSLNSITANYRVFEITESGKAYIATLSPATAVKFRSTLTTEKLLQKAVTDGYLIDITDDVVVDADSEKLVNYNKTTAPATAADDASKVVYATLTKTAAGYKITAADKTSPTTDVLGATTQLRPVLRLDNVLIKDVATSKVPTIAVSVENKTKTYTVDLYTEDKTSASKVYENKLTADYLAGKGSTSDIKYTVGGTKGGLSVSSSKVVFDAGTVATSDTDLIGKYRGVSLTGVETGTTFKLPTNAGFQAVQSKRALVGWAMIKANGDLDHYVDPGAEVTVSDTNGDLRFVAVWADKFDTFVAGSFRNGNTVVKADADSYDGAGDAEKGADGKPIQEDTYPQAIAGTYAVPASVPVVLAAAEVKGIKDGSSGKTVTDALLTTANYNYKTHYLTATTDFTIAEDGDEGVFTLSGNTMNVTAAGATTAKIKGVFKDGTDSYTLPSSGNIATTGEVAWSLKIGDVAPLEAGTNPVKVSISEFTIAGSSVLSDLNPTGVSIDPYKVEWKITKNDTKAKIESDKTITPTTTNPTPFNITNADKATLTPLDAGEIEISVTVTNKDGISKTATKTVTIKPAAYTIVVEDANGTVIGDSAFLEVGANRDTKAHGATSFKVKAVATGSTAGVPGGTWAYKVNKDDSAAGTEIVGTPIAFEAGSNNYQIGYMATNDVVGEDDFVVAWTTTDGTVYQKVVKLKSYYTVTLGGRNPSSGAYYYVTSADGSTVYRKGGTGSDKDDPTTATIKIFADKAIKDKAGNVTHYGPISTAEYSAAYYKDGEKNNSKELVGWKDDSTSNVYGTSIAKLAKGTFANTKYGNLGLNAEMDEYVSAVGWPTSTVVLSNEAGKTNYKEVTLQVTPPTGTAEIHLTADKVEFYTMFAGTVKDDAAKLTPDYTKNGVYALAMSTGSGLYPYAGAADVVAKPTITGSPATSRKDTFTVGAMEDKAGKFTVSLYSTPGTAISALPEGTQPLGTFTVIVSGLTVNADGTKSYIKTTGEKAVSEAVTVGTDTYYFDEEGKAITDEGITTINGKKVLIVSGGALAPKGAYPYKSDMYAIGDNGEVLSGWVTGEFTKASGASNGVYYADPENGDKLANDLYKVGNDTYIFKSYVKQTAPAGTTGYVAYKVSDTVTKYIDTTGKVAMAQLVTVDGKQYLVNENGDLVTYAMSTGGKYKLGNMTYVIDPTDNTAKPDKKMVDARLSWTVSWPKTWKNGDAVPTGHYEITYKFEGESTTQPAIVGPTVSAAQDPAVIGLGVKKVTFTFVAPAADLDGFFSDSKGTVALTDSGVKKTYTFNSSGTGTSGGIEINGFEEGQEFKFTGAAIKPVITVTDNDLGEDLVNGVDYSISYKNNTKITTDSSKMPTVTVNGKGNYAGKTVTRTFKIVSPTEGETGLVASVKKIDVSFGSATPTYNGEAWYPETITVDGTVFQHNSGEDYTTDSTNKVAFSFANNVDAGTATVAATGADGKTKRKTFKINKVDLSAAGSALVIEPDDVDWAVKGAVPNVTATYTPEGGSAITLVPGQDFTISKVNYADRKKNVADGNTVTITGKGTNFTKKATSTETFAIKQLTLSDSSIFSVTAYAGQKVSAAKAIVIDGTGATIAKINYTVNVYDSDMKLITDKNAKFVDGQDYTYEVVAPPTGNLDGSGQFKFKAATNMNSAKVTLSGLAKDGVEYTGEPIDLTQVQNGELIANLFTNGNIKVQYKNSSKQWVDLIYDEDFEVTGYVNNVKKGTMTVYISAKSDCGKVSGTKSFKVKIKAKTMKKAD